MSTEFMGVRVPRQNCRGLFTSSAQVKCAETKSKKMMLGSANGVLYFSQWNLKQCALELHLLFDIMLAAIIALDL